MTPNKYFKYPTWPSSQEDGLPPVKIEPYMWTSYTYEPSELELKIRKEVLNDVDELLVKYQESGLDPARLLKVKDRLTLLWGEE